MGLKEIIAELEQKVKSMLLSEAIELLEENGYVVLIEERNNIQLANKWKKHTELPMNIWIDETATYKLGKHSKRVKFQLNTSDKLQPNELGSIDLNGVLRTELPKNCKLTKKDIVKLQNYILNNKEALELVADMKIALDDIFPYMIKGGDLATNKQKQKLLKEIKKLKGK